MTFLIFLSQPDVLPIPYTILSESIEDVRLLGGTLGVYPGFHRMSHLRLDGRRRRAEVGVMDRCEWTSVRGQREREGDGPSRTGEEGMSDGFEG